MDIKMDPDDNLSFEHLKSALGKRLIGFRRMLFFFENDAPSDSARSELEFEGKYCLFFRGIGGGAQLKIVPEAWVDDYADCSPREIEEIQYEFGLQRRVELISDHPYSSYLDKRLVSVVPLTNVYDFMLGVELEFEGVFDKITIFTSWDENYVVFGDDTWLLSHARLTARFDLKLSSAANP